MPTYALETVAQAICAASGYTFGGGIGQGTFKETFLATKGDGTKVALKVLKPGCSPERSDASRARPTPVEFRLRTGAVSANDLITLADANWAAIESSKPPVIMEERQNNGSWVRQWLRALVEFPYFR